MKRIAIASFAISIISLIMVLFLYMPKFKSQPSFETSDIYLQKIVELYPELQDAVFIDSATSNLYLNSFKSSTYFHSILYNIPIVGFTFSNISEDLIYEFYNLKTEYYYVFYFKEKDNLKDYKLSSISIINSPQASLRKRFFEKDTLVELFDKEGNHYYTLKKNDGRITKFIKFDTKNGDKSFNRIWIASDRYGVDFSVNIALEYNTNLKLRLPAFEGKTIELKINYKNQDYKTTAIINDGKEVPESCRPESYDPYECNFELTAPFENCNLKLDVQHNSVNIRNDIIQLMQCLNIW